MNSRQERRRAAIEQWGNTHPGVPLVFAGLILLAFAMLGVGLLLGYRLNPAPWVTAMLLLNVVVFGFMIYAYRWLRSRRKERDS